MTYEPYPTRASLLARAMCDAIALEYAPEVDDARSQRLLDGEREQPLGWEAVGCVTQRRRNDLQEV